MFYVSKMILKNIFFFLKHIFIYFLNDIEIEIE